MAQIKVIDTDDIATPINAVISGSHRQALRSSAIIGGTQVIGIAMGLLRTKVAALILGPSGIGTIGLLQNLLQIASSLAAAGLGTAGPQQIAQAGDDPDHLARARYVLAAMTLMCAVAGGGIIWAARVPLSVWFFSDRTHVAEVGWLGLGVTLTVITVGQNALLIGMRRIGDAARLGIASSVLGAAIATVAVLAWGEGGLVAFVLATPIAMAATGAILLRRLPRWRGHRWPDQARRQAAVALIRMGAAFVLAGIAGSLGQLALRALLQNALGMPAVGYFQAAWFISITYVGFVLSAMGADYYPRLTAIASDRAATHRLVEEQTEIALSLAGPALLATVAIAPWVITLLYTRDFAPAVAILRWQVLADLLKVMAYPLGYLLLAKGRAWTFMGLEVGFNLVMVGATALLLPVIGIEASGIAILVGYGAYLGAMAMIAAIGEGFRWSRRTLGLAVLLGAVLMATFAAASWSPMAGVGIGLTAAACSAVASYVRLEHALPAALTGRVGHALAWVSRLSRG